MDAVTRARAGSLAAHGLSDQQIADILLLSIEQIGAARNTDEYKKKYAAIAEEEIQKQIDLADGWDGVEEKAIAQVLETLVYNRDPKFALLAAHTANKAIRRKANNQPKVVDGSAPVNNVITLNLNKTYVTNITSGEAGGNTIDVTPRPENTQRKISDLPSPKSVEELLAPVRNKTETKMLTELEQAFEIAGVFKDENPA